MQETFFLLLKILHISLLNILLSFDNISVITSVSNRLPKKFSKKANLIGLSISILFTILFASIISIIMEIQWLPIQLLGALLLIKITIDMLKPDKGKNNNLPLSNPNFSNIKLIKAIIKITFISLSLSFDNILTIAGAADGNIKIISYGLLLSLPIILFVCQLLLKLLAKNKFLLYINGAILIYTAFEMIFSYKFISPFIPGILANIISLIFSFSVILYGVNTIKKLESELPSNKETEEND